MRGTPRHLAGELVRFVAVGAVNTLMTLAIYWALRPCMGYRTAYTLSFCVGIVSGYALNTFLVFRQPWSWRRFAAYPSVHLVNYGFSMLLLLLLVDRLQVDERVAPLLVVALSTPMMFVLTRLVIRVRR